MSILSQLLSAAKAEVVPAALLAAEEFEQVASNSSNKIVQEGAQLVGAAIVLKETTSENYSDILKQLATQAIAGLVSTATGSSVAQAVAGATAAAPAAAIAPAATVTSAAS